MACCWVVEGRFVVVEGKRFVVVEKDLAAELDWVVGADWAVVVENWVFVVEGLAVVEADWAVFVAEGWVVVVKGWVVVVEADCFALNWFVEEMFGVVENLKRDQCCCLLCWSCC